VNSTIFQFLYIAVFPLIFMPSIIALFTRNPRKALVVICNVVIWSLGFLSVRSMVSESSGGFFLPVPVALLGWLALLAIAIKSPKKTPPNA
jgi:hypothetical protein